MTNTFLSLSNAAREIGKDVKTLYRWSTAGLRGVILETVQVGNTRSTTAEALQRFFERISTVQRARGSLLVPDASIGAQRASEELESYGV
jgi:hypothetical protein